jgi:hypothetical protein
MEYKDAISMLFERSGATQTFWNFHFTIILALIAFFASISPNPKLTLLKYFVTAAFLAFAIINLRALVNATDQGIRIMRLADALVTEPGDKEAREILGSSLSPPQIWQVCLAHALADATTIAAIWMLVAKKQREASEKQSSVA